MGRFTKFDCSKGKVKVCQDVTVDRLKEFGFTNYNKPWWYYCRILASEPSNWGPFEISLNVTIDSRTLKRVEIECLDEAFCQPFPLLCEYFLKERTYETLTPYARACADRCEEALQELVNAKILVFEE